jgi:hypothetical protein
VKLIWVESAKNNKLKDVVGFKTDIVLLTVLIPLVKVSKKQLHALKQFFVHCANSNPNVVPL